MVWTYCSLLSQSSWPQGSLGPSLQNPAHILLLVTLAGQTALTSKGAESRRGGTSQKEHLGCTITILGCGIKSHSQAWALYECVDVMCWTHMPLQQSHPSVSEGCPSTGLLLSQLAHTDPCSIQAICGIPPLQHLEEECSWALIHCMITNQEKRPQELGLALQWSVRGWHCCSLCCSSGVRRTKRRKDAHESDALVFSCYSRSLRIMKNFFFLRIT